MKKFFATAAGSAACAAALFVAFSQPASAEKLRAITAPNYAPYEFLEKGELKGFDVDVMAEIARRIGAELEYKYMDFDALIPTLKAGKADIVAALHKKTPQRAKSVAFTTEFKRSSNYLLVNAEQTAVPNTKEICEKQELKLGKIGVENGTVQHDMARALGLEPAGFSEAGVAIMALKTARIAGVLIDKQAATKFLEKNPDLALFCEQPDMGGGQGFLISHENPELLARVNAAIAQMQEDGTLDKLAKQWGL